MDGGAIEAKFTETFAFDNRSEPATWPCPSCGIAGVDLRFARAVHHGATAIQEPKDEPYGRVCKVRDPFGHIWFLSDQL